MSCYSYRHISSRKRKQKIEEPSSKKQLNLGDASMSKRKCSPVLGSSIVKFADQLEIDQRLKKIYESVKKDKAEIEKLEGSMKKSPQQLSPVYR
jgi:hypothetical protein